MTVTFVTRAVRVCALATLCFATVLATAQTERRYTFEAGGGFTPPVGRISQRLNSGWNLGAGAGVNLTNAFSLSAHYMYNGFGVNRGILAAFGAPGGDAHVWSLTAEPRLQLGVGRFAPYLVGGVGYYRRTINFTQPVVTGTTFFDPFFGLLVPGLVGANQVLGSSTNGGIGGSLGAGLSFGLGHGGAKFFTEARYHYADTGRTPTRMIPVTFGIRF